MLEIEEEVEKIKKRGEKKLNQKQETEDAMEVEKDEEEKEEEQVPTWSIQSSPIAKNVEIKVQPYDQTSVVDKFVDLCFNGNFGTIDTFLKSHQITRINCWNRYSVTPVVAACARGNLEIVKYLVNKQFSLISAYGHPSPLYVAVQNNHKDVCNYLLQQNKSQNFDNGVRNCYQNVMLFYFFLNCLFFLSFISIVLTINLYCSTKRKRRCGVKVKNC